MNSYQECGGHYRFAGGNTSSTKRSTDVAAYRRNRGERWPAVSN